MIIELDDVTKVYRVGENTIRALDHVSLKVKAREFISVMGPSGSGKSTLLNLMGCIDTPTSGSVLFDGKEVSELPDRELTRIRLRSIGFIFQQFYLIPILTAMENVEFPMKEARVPKAQRIARTRELLELVGLGDRLDHYPNQLSGGEQQRVAIARAMANDPKLVLADEPTGEVDTHTGDRIISLLKKLNRESGVTVILVTHDPDVAKVASRSLRIVDGKIARASPPDRKARKNAGIASKGR